jgi:hypothetical protein
VPTGTVPFEAVSSRTSPPSPSPAALDHTMPVRFVICSPSLKVPEGGVDVRRLADPLDEPAVAE